MDNIKASKAVLEGKHGKRNRDMDPLDELKDLSKDLKTIAQDIETEALRGNKSKLNTLRTHLHYLQQRIAATIGDL